MPEKIYSKSISRANARHLTLVCVAIICAAGLASCGAHAGSTASRPGSSAPHTVSGNTGRTAGAAGAASAGTPPASGQAGRSIPTAQPAASAPQETPRAAAMSGGSPAFVSFAAGTVTASGKAVRIADPVETGEALTTGKGSSVEVLIENEFAVGLGERTAVTFGLPVNTARETKGRGPLHLKLSLTEGSVIVKAGRELVARTPGPSSTAANNGARPLLVEIHGPHLLVTSRGGSLLFTESVDSSQCAVGLGEAWVLPQSVVYPDLVDRLANPDAVRALDRILAKSVLIRRHEQIEVPSGRLGTVDATGDALKKLLTANRDHATYPAPVERSFTALVKKASDEIAGAVGKPQPLSAALRGELDPASIYHQTMKTTATAESSSGATTQQTAPGGAVGGGSSQTATPAGSGGFPGPTPPTPPTPPTVPQ